jgi:hypothetical protein
MKHRMKTKLTVTVLLGCINAFCYSQCSTYVKHAFDKVTGDSLIYAPKSPIQVSKVGRRISFYWSMDDNSVILGMRVHGSGCISDAGTVNVLFRDGTRVSFTHDQQFNCDDRADVHFARALNNKQVLTQLVEKEIETIRVMTSKSYAEVDLTPTQSSDLMKSGKCMKEIMDQKSNAGKKKKARVLRACQPQ